jgi:transposase
MGRRGRPVPDLVLTNDERVTLTQWTRRRTTAQALATRARIVLACADGLTNSAVAVREAVTRPTVGRWRQRFVDHRCAGLLDEPKPGAPRTITDEMVERALVLTLESTPMDATHWSTRSLAKASGLTQTAVARIWKAFALQPHRAGTFKLSKDPLFIEKVRDIVGLYLHPPDKALVLCVDEKSQVQALQRTAPLLPMRPGQIERRTHDYTRHGTTTLFAALDAKSGAIIGQCQARHRAQEFRRFLNTVDAAVPPDLDVHLIFDNYGTHKAPTVQRWLASHPRYHIHFTPTSASWINLVERWFAELDRKQLRRGNFHGTDELIATIMAYVATSNVAPKPFIWTKTADEILTNVARFCQRTSASGH